MRKFVTLKVRGLDGDWWEEDLPMIPSLQVDGATAEFTGLLDANGSPICKLARPIGFGRDNEW
jgi:hypothetical protein